jgi:hypothetical protein
MMFEAPAIPWALVRLTPRIDVIRLHFGAEAGPTIKSLGSKAQWNWVDDLHQLSIHDPQPRDLAWLALNFPHAEVHYLEVAIDLRPLTTLDSLASESVATDAFLGLAARFDPIAAFPYGDERTMRGYVTARGSIPKPFDLRLPPLGAQLLYGHKADQIQMVVYPKLRDHGKPVSARLRGTRAELRLRRGMLTSIGLGTASNLIGYNFRSSFSPMFRLIEGVVPRRRRPGPLTPLATAVTSYRAQAAWRLMGAAATRRPLRSLKLRKVQDSSANKRFGEALDQLTRTHAREKFTTPDPTRPS